MICGVPRGGHCFDGPPRAADDLAVREGAIRLKLGIIAGIEPRRLVAADCTCWPVRSFCQHQGTGCRLYGRHRRGMVPMRMGDEDVGDGLTTNGAKQRAYVRLIQRTGIDDRDMAAADDVRDRPPERERARIVGEDPPHPGHDLLDFAGREIERLVERDIVAHLIRVPGAAQHEQR